MRFHPQSTWSLCMWKCRKWCAIDLTNFSIFALNYAHFLCRFSWNRHISYRLLPSLSCIIRSHWSFFVVLYSWAPSSQNEAFIIFFCQLGSFRNLCEFFLLVRILRAACLCEVRKNKNQPHQEIIKSVSQTRPPIPKQSKRNCWISLRATLCTDFIHHWTLFLSFCMRSIGIK